MNTIILAGGDLQARKNYLGNLQNPQTELIHLTAEKTSLTIKQVQDLAIPLSISPRLPRIVWIEEANLLTIPAQNSLLKMLEEPPAMTSFYLTCQTSTMLLPTIRSRCQIIEITKTLSSNDPKILSDLKLIMAMTPGDRLSSILKRDRSETILWLTQIESALSEKMTLSQGNPKSLSTLAKIAKLALLAHKQLLSNCSVSLVTQSFYLLLPHTHSTK